MKNLPKISIVTPSYNQGQFLRETIESVLNQNYPNLEYFIVDGGSTDNSVEIIQEYEDRIDWWVSEPDEGQSDALCKGFDRATGDLIGWLNSDDVYFPGALKKIGRTYARSPGASIYVGGIAVGEFHNGGIKRCSIPSAPSMWIKRYGLMTIGQQASFYNTEIYRKIGGINRDLFHRMDGNLWYRLMKCHPRAIIINDIVGFIRFHDAAKSSTAAKLYIEEKAAFEASLGIPHWQYRVAVNLHRLFRLINGGYFKSWLATRHYRGMRMSEVWAFAKTFGV